MSVIYQHHLHIIDTAFPKSYFKVYLFPLGPPCWRVGGVEKHAREEHICERFVQSKVTLASHSFETSLSIFESCCLSWNPLYPMEQLYHSLELHFHKHIF